MKKTVLILLSIVLILTLSACGGNKENNNANTANNSAGSSNGADHTADSKEPVTIKVGATPVPHAEILNFVAPKLAEMGVQLEVVEFNDYVQPNVQLNESQLDANFFQHAPYLDQFNSDKGYDLVSIGGVHIEPFGAYSEKIKSVDELKKGSKIAIPNDPSNGGRALALLAKQGLISLKEGVGVNGTVNDIVDNAKELEFVELEAATLPRVLGEVDLATINTNYALEAGLVPTKDALFIEDKDSPYVNIVVSRQDNKDSDALKKLMQALQSEEVAQFIKDKYKDAILPAF